MDDLVAKALHAARQHLAGGGFLSDLFSGPDYQSTGEVASPTNWGDPDSAADFFRADKALRLAREAQAREEPALIAPRPGAVEARELPPPSAPLSFAPEPEKNPARVAIDEATKLTGRAPQEMTGADSVWTRMLKQESGNRQFDRSGRTITSPAGALGISQVMPSTGPEAAQLAGLPWSLERLRTDPEYNHALGRAYYDAQLARFGDPVLAAAAYNGGPGRVAGALRQAQATGRPWTDFLKPETQNYVRVVGRAEGGLVDDALRVVRERHADGEAVGLEMPAEEPRPLTIYRDNAPVADEAGGSGREAVPAFSYMPMPESVERQAARQPAYNPAERTWSDAGSTEGERLTRALGVEGELPKGETTMSAQPSGWDKYKPQRVPGTFLKRWGEAADENIQSMSEGYQAAKQGNYGAGALGMLGGAFGAAISPLTGMERVLVRDPYLRMTGNLKDAQAAEMAADVALTGGLRGMVKPFAKAGNLEKLAAEPLTSAYRLPSPAATGAATAAGAMLAPEDAEASKLSKAMEVARMAIPRELSPLGFYSHGAEAARGLPQAKGTAQQFTSMLDKAGIRGPEMESYLQTFGGRPIVTKDEIAKHFQDTMPQVEETVLAGRKPVLSETEKEKWIDAQAAERARETGDIDHVRDWANASPEIRDWHREETIKNFNERMVNDFGFAEQFNDYVGTPTKFGQYTLPGGENYREVLLKTPVQGSEAAALNKIAQDMYGKNYTDLMGDTSDLAKMRLAIKREYKNQYGESGLKAEDAAMFRSQHWDDPNVLAHLRLADRTGPNGEKILHVEEIQSDWGQKGKKEGFDGPKVDLKPFEADRELARMASVRLAQNMIVRESGGKFNSLSEVLDSGDVDLINRMRAAKKTDAELISANEAFQTADRALQEARAGNRSSIPTAPYVTNTQAWTDLALKRALKEAAEGGYDKLVWTPGAEQAKRYSLSNQVRSIDYMKEGDNSYRLGIVDKRGEGIDLPKETFTAKELEDYLGRDVANKIINDEGQSYRGRNHKSLEGVDLVLGGEGMKGYYDKIVPNQLSKLVKKLDPEAKVGVHDLITKKGGKVADEAALNENSQLIEQGRFWDDARAENVNGYRVTSPGGQELGVFEDLPDAHDALLQVLGSAKEPDTILKVPSLTITPKMRDSILRGQSAHARGGEVVDHALHAVRRHFAGDEGSYVDPMGSVAIPAAGAPSDAAPSDEPGLVDRAMQFVSQFNPVGTAEAAKLPKLLGTFKHPVSGTKLVTPIEEMRPVFSAPTEAITPRRPMDWASTEGGVYMPATWDRSRGDRAILEEINGQKLTNPQRMEGGPLYMNWGDVQPKKQVAASGQSIVDRMIETSAEAKKLAGDKDVYLANVLMGLEGADFSHMVANPLVDLARQRGFSKSEAALVDDAIRKSIIQNLPSKAPMDKKVAYASAWPGIMNPDLDQLMWKMGGGYRSAIAKAMDTAAMKTLGVPDVASIRHAATQPELLNSPNLSTGFSVAKVDPGAPSVSSGHTTYPVGMKGLGYEGGSQVDIPFNLFWRDFMKTRQPGESMAHTQRAFTMQMPVQRADPQWVDTISNFERNALRGAIPLE